MLDILVAFSRNNREGYAMKFSETKRSFSKHFSMILLFSFVFTSLCSEISITGLKGLNPFTRESQYLSPVWGCVSWKSGYIENIYRYEVGQKTKKGEQQTLTLHSAVQRQTSAETVLPFTLFQL